MNLFLRAIGALTILSCLTSCADLRFYKDEKGESPTLFKYYGTAPHLLISSAAPNAPPTATIIWLPDRDDVTYIKFRPGIGQHKFDVTVSNGMLSSIGNQGDTKIAETLGAVAQLMTAKAQLITAKDEAAAKALEAKGYCQLTDELREGGSTLARVADELQADVIEPAVRLKYVLDSQRVKLEALRRKAQSAAEALKAEAAKDPAARKPCSDTANAVRALLQGWTEVRLDAPGKGEGEVISKKFETLRLDVIAVIVSLDPATAAAGAFQLYKIIPTGSTTTLVPAIIRR